MMAFDEILARFPGKHIPNGKGGFKVTCPLHDDKTPSLSITPANGAGPRFHCFSCKADRKEFIEAAGMKLSDILPPREKTRKPSPAAASQTPGKITRYEIRDSSGTLVAVHVRKDYPDGSKEMPWNMPDGTPKLVGIKLVDLPLYGSDRLPEDATVPVVVCEGEKTTDALLQNRIPALGTFGTDVMPGDDVLRPLLGRTVYLWPDNDDAGRKHMDKIGEALLRLGHTDVRVIDWRGAPPKGDAADLFALEGARDEFDVLRDEAQAFPGTRTEPVTAPAIGPKAPLFASLSSLLANPRPQRWLVKRLIEAPSTTMFFGPSGCGKSFIAVDLAGATATGGQWAGHAVVGGPVFYIAGEGRIGLLRRFRAWQLKRGVTIPEDRLFLSVVSIELNASGAAEVALEVERRAKDNGEPPALIIVDTLSRMMPAGGDENATKDMMAFVKAVDQIRDRFDCVAVIVHHAGVADDKRARGSTSLKAAMDAELCITKRGAIRTAEWTKLKDLPDEPHPQEFALESELLGQDEDGNLITSAVVAWQGRAAVRSITSTTKAENLGLETLRAALAGGDNTTLFTWRPIFYAKHWGDCDDAKQKSFRRVRESLASKGLISIDGDHYSIPLSQGRT
jgi:hypothetical protein